ncbi:MAG: hypothetical protein M1839_001440 [Geoglossum umbratile]|nr:MAG: hypothetical protein M1839_001440 [Geoglossum umbratile]
MAPARLRPISPNLNTVATPSYFIASPMPASAEPSLVRVYPPGEAAANLDIVAVGADPEIGHRGGVTWLSHPKALSALVPKAGIWTFNYNT